MRLVDPVQGEPQFTGPDADEAKFVTRWAPDLRTAAKELTFGSETMFAERALQTLTAPDATIEP
jgi:hypothetical protein